jgi:hypothetical protein
MGVRYICGEFDSLVQYHDPAQRFAIDSLNAPPARRTLDHTYPLKNHVHFCLSILCCVRHRHQRRDRLGVGMVERALGYVAGSPKIGRSLDAAANTLKELSRY